jgi:thiamine pyrophosphate-dependent acetolactate synthase large subunit-like protein
MRRYDCLERLARSISEQTLVVCNLQDTTYEWQHIRPSDGNLLRQGMALVTPVAFGLAKALPHRQVVALDGDGSILLGPGIMTTLARYAPKNLLVLIFDNETYNSGGVLPSATAYGASLECIARGMHCPWSGRQACQHGPRSPGIRKGGPRGA